MKVRARAAKAAAGTLVTDEVLQDETDDSKAVIEHVKNQVSPTAPLNSQYLRTGDDQLDQTGNSDIYS